MVVNQMNDLVVLLEAVNGYTNFADGGLRFRNHDVGDSFPVPVVHLERFPVRGEARFNAQDQPYIQPAEPVYQVHPPRPV